MAYKMRSDGSFRLRASFPMNRQLILKANAVCDRFNVSMYALCYEAVNQYCDRRLAADESGLPESEGPAYDQEYAEAVPA